MDLQFSGACFYIYRMGDHELHIFQQGETLPSSRLTASLHLKIDGTGRRILSFIAGQPTPPKVPPTEIWV